MGRNMHLWRFGHFGQPVIVFPTAAGFAHEWKAQGMVDVLADMLGGGRIKLYCPESNVSTAWTRKEMHPAERIQHHLLYERWVMEVLVPWVRADCRSNDMPLACVGSSLGGFYAATFALKHPETFRYALCLSGRYEMRNFTGGYDNASIYFNNPLAFVPNLDGQALQRTRQTRISLVCGTGKWEEGCIEETQALAAWFRRKQIPHREDIWGRDSRHDWDWWKKQARMHLKHEFG